MTGSKTSLSQPQVEALLAGVEQKLVRVAMDWVSREEVNFSETMRFRSVERFRLSTIRSLHRRGLLSSNFEDPRIHQGFWKGIQSTMWTLERYPSETPLVWTNSVGRELLCDFGLLPSELIDNVIPFAGNKARCGHSFGRRQAADIVDLTAYREKRNCTAAQLRCHGLEVGNKHER